MRKVSVDRGFRWFVLVYHTFSPCFIHAMCGFHHFVERIIDQHMDHMENWLG